MHAQLELLYSDKPTNCPAAVGQLDFFLRPPRTGLDRTPVTNCCAPESTEQVRQSWTSSGLRFSHCRHHSTTATTTDCHWKGKAHPRAIGISHGSRRTPGPGVESSPSTARVRVGKLLHATLPPSNTRPDTPALFPLVV